MLSSAPSRKPRPVVLAALLSAGLSCAILTACTAQTGSTADTAVLRRASATLRDSAGSTLGTVQLVQLPGSVRLIVAASGLAPGQHGIHFHAVGNCQPSGATVFAAAGGHFNPGSRKHGLESPDGPHAGDLPNISVDSAGRVATTLTTERVTLSDGPNSLLDADGSAIVVHAAADDQRTDPAGNSGARVACGVVTRAD